MKNASQPLKRLALPLAACFLASWLAGCDSMGRRGVVESSPGAPKHVDIPKDFYPPPGKCRIWVPGMAPGLQSAPDDCDRLRPMMPKGAVLVRG